MTGEKSNLGGATYKVDLAPAEDEYLLWDKPFEAKEKVQAHSEAWDEQTFTKARETMLRRSGCGGVRA